MLVGTTDGNLFRIFAPPWWRIDRWARWYFAFAAERFGKKRERPARGFVVIDGVRVRVISDAMVLQNVPRRVR